VTSTADPALTADTRRRTGAGLLGILCLILLGQALTPEPWMYLWPMLPIVGAAALLLTQTQFPALGWFPPLACLGALFAFQSAGEPWGWCLVAGALAAAMLGLAEREGAEPTRRAWAFLPVLTLAAAFPLAPGYGELTDAVARAITSEEVRQLASLRGMNMPADQKVAVEQMLALTTAAELSIVRHVLPAFLFVWIVLLVHLAERMARRLAELVRRPLAPAAPFANWRLPDGAVWLLVAGLTLLATRDARVVPVGINLAVAVGLAFALQGLAVVKSFLTTHGMTPGLVTMLFLFTSLTLGPVVPMACAGVGLMDLWLDFRRLEPRADKIEPEGGDPWK